MTDKEMFANMIRLGYRMYHQQKKPGEIADWIDLTKDERDIWTNVAADYVCGVARDEGMDE